jgi:hypothetical protein
MEQMEHMEKKITENREYMEKRMNENREHMEKKTNENRNKMENKMDTLKIYILQTLDGRLAKSDIVSVGTHKNKGSIQFEQLPDIKNFLGGSNSNSGVTYGWFPKGVILPKVELKKFYGT